MLALASLYTYFPLIPLFYRRKINLKLLTDLYWVAAFLLILLTFSKVPFGLNTDLKFIVPLIVIVVFFPTKILFYRLGSFNFGHISILNLFIVITIVSICWAMFNKGMFWEIKRDIWKEAGIFSTNNVIAYFLTCTFLVENFKNKRKRIFELKFCQLHFRNICRKTAYLFAFRF